MPEFFLELFSEEIPARMQEAGTTNLAAAIETALAALKPDSSTLKLFYGPRRIAISAELSAKVEASKTLERGPRLNAPEQAMAGFLRKHGASKEQLGQEGDFWVLHMQIPETSARQLILDELPKTLSKIPWPKSMRWGQSDSFTWVRPLRRIICLLDGEIIPITLGPITASNETEGHRFLSPGAFAVSSAQDWELKLKDRYVIADQNARRQIIFDDISAKAQALGLNIVEDSTLIDEVTGLVEYPVPLIGNIDENFMDLPPEVRELSMKVNQRYFALRDAAGKPAPYFAFVSNTPGIDNAAAIIVGNERVLRARLSDARHFWDQDLKTPLDELLPKLDKITFHAKIGTQGQRVKRIAALAKKIAENLGADETIIRRSEWAGLLSKADLVTGMVGEFPELQGVVGGYYATKNPNGWDAGTVGTAIATHYQPKGPRDEVPSGVIAVSVALADKLDTLIEFFRVGEKPTGSGDPYALRRAALGVIRIILENKIHFRLKTIIGEDAALFNFIIDRLRVRLRGEEQRFDILDAVLAADQDDDLLRLMMRAEALSGFITSENGSTLLSGYKRAANILKIEDTKDGPHLGNPNATLFETKAETDFFQALDFLLPNVSHEIAAGRYAEAMGILSDLRKFVDIFFEVVTVNSNVPKIRLNRLRLLARFRDTVHQIADFSKIEG